MVLRTDSRVMAIAAEMVRVRREFEAALDAVPPGRVHVAPPGQWTPAQIIWHLAKVERGVASLVVKLDATIPLYATVPPGPRLDVVLTLLDIYDFRNRSRKVAAPDLIRPPDTGQIDLTAERERWSDGRVRALSAMQSVGPRLSLLSYPHPFFGPLDGWQWALLIARHEERHLLQLHEVTAEVV